MDYDSLKTDRDDVVRDGADFEAYRRPGALIDSDHPKITDYASRVAGEGSDREKALRLYYAVRDGLRYDPYNTPMKREAYLASTTLGAGHGYCVNKAGLMAALCRAVGIPARVGYADVRNHMTTKRLSDLMGSRHLLLSRLHRGLARRPLDQGHARLQQGADRALRPEAARLGRRRRFDLSPVRSRRPAPHGVSRLSRRLRRHPVRRDPRRLSALLPAHDARSGGDAAGGTWAAISARKALQKPPRSESRSAFLRLRRPVGGVGQLRPADHEHLHAGDALGRRVARRRRRQRQAHAHHLHAGLRRRPALLRAAQRPLRPPAGACWAD